MFSFPCRNTREHFDSENRQKKERETEMPIFQVTDHRQTCICRKESDAALQLQRGADTTKATRA
jgi:hypothetical protein